MRGSQHLALGVAIGSLVAASHFTTVDEKVLFAVPCVIGELFPDIDISTSKLGSKTFGASSVINKVFGHRGFVHTPVNAVIITGLIYLISNLFLTNVNAAVISFGFFTGFILHLLQDTFTRGGIMWFWPIPFKIRFTKLKSDSPWCWVITGVIFLSVLFTPFAEDIFKTMFKLYFSMFG